MEKRKRESSTQVELNRVESHGKRGRNRLTPAEGERMRRKIIGATTVYIYFLSVARRRKTEEAEGTEERQRGRARRERERETTRSEARKTMCWCTSTTEFIIGGKERRRAKRRD